MGFRTSTKLSVLIIGLLLTFLLGSQAQKANPSPTLGLVVKNPSTEFSVNGISLGSDIAKLQMDSRFELVKGDPPAVVDRGTRKKVLYLAEADGKVIGLYSRPGSAIFRGSEFLFEIGSEATGLGALPPDFRKVEEKGLIVYETSHSQLYVFVKSGKILEFQYLFKSNPAPPAGP